MNTIRTWLCATALAFLSGCGGGSPDPVASVLPARAGVADIGPSGGSVSATFEGGATVTLTVPAGAVTATTTFRIDPASAPLDAKTAMSMSPAGLEFRKPATLSISLPAGSDAKGLVATFDILGTRVPVGSFDTATRTMAVDLNALGIGAAGPDITGLAAGRATALSNRARPEAGGQSNTAIQLLILSGTLDSMVQQFEQLVMTFSNNGTRDNGVLVELAFGAVLNAGINNNIQEQEVRPYVASWGNKTCGQLTFAISSVNSASTTQSTPVFNQAAKDVMAWGFQMSEYFRLTKLLVNIPPLVSCPALQNDIAAPIRAAFPTFLNTITGALSLLDPINDLNQIITARLKELVTLMATLQGANLDPESNQLGGLIADQFRRERQGAYDDCRLNLRQISQRDLLVLAIVPTFDFIRPFSQSDLISDIEFCGVSIAWETRDAQGTVLHSGSVGGGAAAGTVKTADTVDMTGADKLVIKGPLSALMCPGSLPGATTTVSPHANNEQLGFDAGPLGGALSSVGVITSANNSRYLENVPLELPVATLKPLVQPTGRGNGELDIQRQRDTCSSEFPNFTQHSKLAKLELDFFDVRIATNSLQRAAVGLAYSDTLAATGGTQPLTWQATGLPAGLSLAPSTGVISGKATTAGAFTVNVTVTSADGSTAQAAIPLNVSNNFVYVGSLVDTISQPTFNDCFAPGRCILRSGSLRDEYSNLRVVLQPNGTFTATGTVTHTSRDDSTNPEGCQSSFTETGSGTVTGFGGNLSDLARGVVTFVSISASGTATVTVTSSACNGQPGSTNTSTSSKNYIVGNGFFTAVFSGSLLVSMGWNGSSFDPATNTTNADNGTLTLVP